MSEPKTKIELDMTPVPFIVHALMCPLCGDELFAEYNKDFQRLIYEHRPRARFIGAYLPQCAGVHKRYVIDADLRVRQT